MKNKIKLVLFIIVALSVVMFLCVKVHLVNREFVPPELRYNKMNEWVQVKEGKFSIIVSNFKVLKEPELIKMIPSTFDSVKIDKYETVGYIVSISLKNNENKDSEFDLTELILSTDTFANGINLYSNIELESKLKEVRYFKNNEEKSFKLLYTSSEIMFSKENWKKKENLEYKLVSSLYPIYQKILLE